MKDNTVITEKQKRKYLEELEGFKKLEYNDRERLVKKLPKRTRAWIYSRYASKEQLNDLLNEWHNLGKVREIRALKKEIKRVRRAYYNKIFKYY